MLIIILSIIIIIPVLAGFKEIFQRFLGKFGQDFLLSCFQGIFFLAMIWQVLAFYSAEYLGRKYKFRNGILAFLF